VPRLRHPRRLRRRRPTSALCRAGR
jgi:hypothetical protein